MQLKENRVFLDTNVLINDFFFRNPKYIKINSKDYLPCYETIKFLKKNKNKYKIFVSSHSIARFISLLNDKKVPKSISISEIKILLNSYEIVNLTKTLIEKVVTEFEHKELVKDLEDAFQYQVSSSNGCLYLFTINTKDFKNFLNVKVLHPKNYRTINY